MTQNIGNNALQLPLQQQQPHILTRKIGNTLYSVSVHFSSKSKETLNDKLLRLIKNDGIVK